MSGVFDLDEEGAAALDEQVRLNPLDPASMVSAWAGSGEAAKGLLAPSAAAGRALTLAGAVEPIARDAAASLVTGQRTTERQDAYFEDVVEGFGQTAVDFWKPDAATMGSAAKVLNVAANVVGSVPQIVATPGLFLGTAALDPAAETIRQGGSTGTAAGVGGVSLAANALGFRLPAAFGSNLFTRAATGAATNLGVGTVADASTAAILDAGGLDKMAAGYNWDDPYARGLDALMGVAFGYKAHLDATPTMTTAQRDAVLVANNADHHHRRTLPGEPMNAAAARAHVSALEQAMTQLLAGEPVDVAATLKGHVFALRPEAGGPPDLASYDAMLVALESGGRADAKASTSNAFGLHQFTPATWRATVAKAAPAWAKGLSDADLLAARADPAKSAQMERVLRAENAQALAAAGLEADPFSLYAAHHFGAERGVRFAKAAGDTPIEKILTKEQIGANPYLKGKTKAEVLANWSDRAQRAGIVVEVAPRLEETAPTLDEPETFAASEPATPRTPEEASAVLDQRMTLLEQLASMDRLSRENVAALRAEDSGLVAQIRTQERRQRENLESTDSDAALSTVGLDQLTARRTEIRQAIERHGVAMGYQNELRRLREQVGSIEDDRQRIELAEQLHPARRIDASLRRPMASQKPIETASKRAPVMPKAASVARAGAEPSSPTANRRAEVSVETPIQAAQRLLVDVEDAAVLDGFDGDGAPRYRQASEVLAEIDAERAVTERDAQGFSVAVSCFLRRGAYAT